MPLKFKKTESESKSSENEADNMKNNKPKSKLKPKIQIVNYTEKSFVVIGDTFYLKELLKTAGGKWNPHLKQKEDITKGWIFPMTKINVIKDLIATTQA